MESVSGMSIRSAKPGDGPALTALARASKRAWGYPDEWMATFSKRLVVDDARIASARVRVAVDDDDVALGFSVATLERDEAHLDDLWISPTAQRQGIGRLLLDDVLAWARSYGATVVTWQSDPHADAFYLKVGARQTGTKPAPMPGAPDRTLALFRVEL